MPTIKGNARSNTLIGKSRDDEIWGYGGNDLLDGGAGNDRLWAGDGDDLLYGGLGYDTLFGGLGSDHLWGGDNNDSLHGDASQREVGDDYMELGSADWLYGDAGNDTLYGEVGGDHLWGGDGADQFSVLRADHSSAADPDTIYDFDPSEGDTIWTPSADLASQPFTYVTSRSFTGAEAIFTTLDADGDGAVDDTRLDLYLGSAEGPVMSLILLDYLPSPDAPTAGLLNVV